MAIPVACVGRWSTLMTKVSSSTSAYSASIAHVVIQIPAHSAMYVGHVLLGFPGAIAPSPTIYVGHVLLGFPGAIAPSPKRLITSFASEYMHSDGAQDHPACSQRGESHWGKDPFWCIREQA